MFLRLAWTRPRRRWLYAISEIACISVFAISFSAVVYDRGFPLGAHDPGMARITAICFMIVAAATFVVTLCIKRLDVKCLVEDE